MLECTGLGEVFQSALMPYLLYLPTLTPEKESLQLLSAVYPTLIALVNARFAEETDLASRTKAFDQVFRYGVLKGYAHAGENVRIAEFLVCRSTDLIKEMGIASMKHLKVREVVHSLSKWSLKSLLVHTSSALGVIDSSFRNRVSSTATSGIASIQCYFLEWLVPGCVPQR